MDIKELLLIIGGKEVDLFFLRKQVAELSAKLSEALKNTTKKEEALKSV